MGSFGLVRVWPVIFGLSGLIFLLAGDLLELSFAHARYQQRSFAGEVGRRHRGRTVFGHDYEMLDLAAGDGDHAADRADPLAAVVVATGMPRAISKVPAA
jgi:hypothetical protein